MSILSRYIHLNPIRVQAFRNYTNESKAVSLFKYPWSSLPGYLDISSQEEMVDYSAVLADFGGAISKGRAAYHKQLLADLSEELAIKNTIFSQSVIGGESFLKWVKETFFLGKETKEQPAAAKIKNYRQKETILAMITEETGKEFDTIKHEKGNLRRLTMDLLFRHGGLRGPEIGELFGVGYSAVSQERKRLRESKKKDGKIEELEGRLEDKLSTIRI